MALQFNYLMDKQAFVVNKDGTFGVNMANVRHAVRDLTNTLVNARGDGQLCRSESHARWLRRSSPSTSGRARRARRHSGRHRPDPGHRESASEAVNALTGILERDRGKFGRPGSLPGAARHRFKPS